MESTLLQAPRPGGRSRFSKALPAPPPELIDTAVDGREPGPVGNANGVALLATMGIAALAAPGKARLKGSRSRVGGLSVTSDEGLLRFAENEDEGGRVTMLPGWVKYEASRSRAAPTEPSDVVAEDLRRNGTI